MKAVASSPSRAVPKRAQLMPAELARLVESVKTSHEQTPDERVILEDAVFDAFRAREQRELADLDVRRSIFKLVDAGLSQRTIAPMVGLSQAEVSRRIKRRSLTPSEPTPREVVLRRAVGLLTSKQMMDALSTMVMTSTPPDSDSSFDGAATSRGSARQLGLALQDGLLTPDEYEQLRLSITTVREDRPA